MTEVFDHQAHRYVIRNLWKLVQDLVSFDPADTFATEKLTTLQKRAKEIIEQKKRTPGNYTNLEFARKISGIKRRAEADKYADKINELIDSIVVKKDLKTNRQISEALNKMGVKTRTGKNWTPLTVFRIRNKAENNDG